MLSFVPESIPCREKERKEIYDYLYHSIQNKGNGSPLYISGMPGTGKTATVRDNIRLAKPDASDAEVEAAARAAHADSFIRRLPEGYDTVLSDTGGALSAGQRQLLCIARVMLRLPPMLILDEATSSIDTRTEAHIQQAFDTMMQARTSFVVAHRLSTIREADVILVMKDGHIVEQGNHDELLAQGGFYAELYNSQFEGVET